ncbi:tRNA (adenosine(37)-N6)-threonylcarbamoyltransferase complex dimerization subunit type 1 TsaB [Roseivirga sp. BDSF3-8]|uniref:tRNA (adenosine(37)-N6)-threonylcarbamoyltransferase complex dimerization subunit type 1 TsaB n=1 Tax=Roseivirga sp. BDSF3-8 TaxID=3241598 RepID=UPI003531CE18
MPDRPARILSIETATPVCSVALHENGELLGAQELHLAKSHSAFLSVMIDQLLGQCQLTLHDLTAIAVSEGPGSYTGLRIGTSTAKGLCYSLDIPLIAISTLLAMAEGLSTVAFGALLCPMIDARRMEVYSLVANSQLEILEEVQPVILDQDSYAAHLKEHPVLFFGDGAGKSVELLRTHPNFRYVPGVSPSAIPLGRLAWKAYQDEIFKDVAYYEPFYLKEFRAGIPKKQV